MFFIMIILVIQCCCSKQPLRIYGGINAKPDEYPYVVRIELQHYFRSKNDLFSYYQHYHLCTASALSSVWVLSAAHCIQDLNKLYHGPPYSVEKLVIRHGHVAHVPGIHDSFSDVLFTVPNPEYTPFERIDTVGIRRRMKHDIGLLKTQPMNITSYAKLSAVDYKCLYGHEAILAGFGTTTKTHPGGMIETKDTLFLRKPLQVLKISIVKCNLAENKILGLCLAKRCDHESTACGGDSGGPVLHASGVIGVLSMGVPSGFCLYSNEKKTDNIAAYVIAVTPYIEWIYNFTKN